MHLKTIIKVIHGGLVHKTKKVTIKKDSINLYHLPGTRVGLFISILTLFS